MSVHLLVLVHGMWGNPGHLSELERHAKEKEDSPFHVLLAKTNMEDSTYDGIDWGGERVAEEILEEVQKLAANGQEVTKFSITGYSLGGLVSRYVVGVLYQKGFFRNVQPMNFNTIATPHVGLPRYPTFLSTIANVMGPRLLSRTGEQFYNVDKWSKTGKPLLEAMSNPDLVFYKGLASFERIGIYGNAVNDTTVPFPTAGIELEDPFFDHDKNGIEIEFEEKYPHVIKSYSLPPIPPAQTPKPIILSKDWFNQRKSSKRPSLPPFLKFRFPLNIVFYALLPLLIPTVATLVVIRFSKASKKSRDRIKAMELERPENLAQALAQLEHDIEEAVVEMMEEPQQPTNAEEVDDGEGREKHTKDVNVLSPLQQRMVAQLNQLPINKKFAYFPEIFNSHGSIIMRDVKRFPFQMIGEGLVRYWADSLVV